DKFFVSSIVTKSTHFNIETGEVAIFQTPANHFKGAEGVGGSLCITGKRLLFKSHNLNVQNHELSISLLDIASVDQYKTLGLINNGIAVHITDNLTEKFVVDKADKWVEQILKTKNGLQQVHLQ